MTADSSCYKGCSTVADRMHLAFVVDSIIAITAITATVDSSFTRALAAAEVASTGKGFSCKEKAGFTSEFATGARACEGISSMSC